MSIRNRFTDFLNLVQQRVYVGPVRAAAHRSGMHTILSDVYWHSLFRTSGGTQTHLINDISATFTTSTVDEYQRVYTLMGEQAVLESLLSALRPDDIVYDIGANIGIYTCFLAAAGAKRVVAFEPHPSNISRLQDNLDINDLDAAIFRGALSDSEGIVPLEISDSDDPGKGEHALATEWEGGQIVSQNMNRTLEVDVIRGDTLIFDGEFSPPSVLKIDVEGAELSVLRGLSEALETTCRLVYCEVHPNSLPDYGGSVEEVYEELRSHGFSIETEETEQRKAQHFIRAEKPATDNINSREP